MAKKAKKVIGRSSISSFIPLIPTLVVWLTLDRLGAPAWVCGVVYTLVALVWIDNIHGLCTEEVVELKELKVTTPQGGKGEGDEQNPT